MGRKFAAESLAKQEDEQGLRATVCQRGGVHLRGDESLDGKTLGSLVSLLGQFL